MAKSITIRGIPDDVHAELTRRAALHGQSLQQFLVALLREVTDQADMQELLIRIRERAEREGVRLSGEEIVQSIHAGRAEREEHLLSSSTRRSSSRRS